jgi:hypothetical protein
MLPLNVLEGMTDEQNELPIQTFIWSCLSAQAMALKKLERLVYYLSQGALKKRIEFDVTIEKENSDAVNLGNLNGVVIILLDLMEVNSVYQMWKHQLIEAWELLEENVLNVDSKFSYTPRSMDEKSNVLSLLKSYRETDEARAHVLEKCFELELEIIKIARFCKNIIEEQQLARNSSFPSAPSPSPQVRLDVDSIRTSSDEIVFNAIFQLSQALVEFGSQQRIWIAQDVDHLLLVAEKYLTMSTSTLLLQDLLTNSSVSKADVSKACKWILAFQPNQRCKVAFKKSLLHGVGFLEALALLSSSGPSVGSPATPATEANDSFGVFQSPVSHSLLSSRSKSISSISSLLSNRSDSNQNGNPIVCPIGARHRQEENLGSSPARIPSSKKRKNLSLITVASNFPITSSSVMAAVPPPQTRHSIKDNSFRFWSTAAEDLKEFTKEKEQPVNPEEVAAGVDLSEGEERGVFGENGEETSPDRFSESIYDDDERPIETSSQFSEAAELFEETAPGAFMSSYSDRIDSGSFDTKFDLEMNLFQESLRERIRVSHEQEEEGGRMLVERRSAPVRQVSEASRGENKSWGARLWSQIRSVCGCVEK